MKEQDGGGMREEERGDGWMEPHGEGCADDDVLLGGPSVFNDCRMFVLQFVKVLTWQCHVCDSARCDTGVDGNLKSSETPP